MSTQRVSPHKSSMYAPLRYEATRPYAAYWGKKCAIKLENMTLEKRREFLLSEVAPSMTSELQKIGTLKGPGVHQAELSNIQAFGSFIRGGKQIYDIHMALSSELMETDVIDLSVSDIPKIAESFYIHFGTGVEIGSDRNKIEGVFVNWANGIEVNQINLRFVISGFFSNNNFWSNSMGENLVSASIDLSDPSKDIMRALEDTCAKIDNSNREIMNSFKTQLEEIQRAYGGYVDAPLPWLCDDIPLLKTGVSMTLKALLYIASTPSDLDEIWDDRAPIDYVEKTRNPKPSISGNAISHLLGQDYIKIRVVGNHFNELRMLHEQRIRNEESSGHGSKKITHKRHSHLRRQAYGPEYSLRKVIFISEIIVNPGQDEGLGRIYDMR
jgi:hypothetical protein